MCNVYWTKEKPQKKYDLKQFNKIRNIKKIVSHEWFNFLLLFAHFLAHQPQKGTKWKSVMMRPPKNKITIILYSQSETWWKTHSSLPILMQMNHAKGKKDHFGRSSSDFLFFECLFRFLFHPNKFVLYVRAVNEALFW